MEKEILFYNSNPVADSTIFEDNWDTHHIAFFLSFFQIAKYQAKL